MTAREPTNFGGCLGNVLLALCIFSGVGLGALYFKETESPIGFVLIAVGATAIGWVMRYILTRS